MSSKGQTGIVVTSDTLSSKDELFNQLASAFLLDPNWWESNDQRDTIIVRTGLQNDMNSFCVHYRKTPTSKDLVGNYFIEPENLGFAYFIKLTSESSINLNSLKWVLDHFEKNLDGEGGYSTNEIMSGKPLFMFIMFDDLKIYEKARKMDLNVVLQQYCGLKHNVDLMPPFNGFFAIFPAKYNSVKLLGQAWKDLQELSNVVIAYTTKKSKTAGYCVLM